MKTLRMKHTLTLVASLAVLLVSVWLGVQQSTAQQGPPQGPPPGGGPPRPGSGQGRGPGIEALAVDDQTGFEAIFDGKTLKGWDGDPEAWRVEDGAIVGQSTAEKPLKANTFLVYRGSQPSDFELKLDYRINSTNSGLQYRSVELPDVGKWVLKGYQADIDFDNRFTGQLYEERGRGFMAMRGQMTHITPGKKRIIANLRSGDELKAAIKNNDWNTLHIIARGNRLTHILNGHLMAEAVDDDPTGRAMSGLIGLQMHTGPPMKVEYRNIGLKRW